MRSPIPPYLHNRNQILEVRKWRHRDHGSISYFCTCSQALIYSEIKLSKLPNSQTFGTIVSAVTTVTPGESLTTTTLVQSLWQTYARTDITTKGLRFVYRVGHGLWCVFLLSTWCYMAHHTWWNLPSHLAPYLHTSNQILEVRKWSHRNHGSISWFCRVKLSFTLRSSCQAAEIHLLMFLFLSFFLLGTWSVLAHLLPMYPHVSYVLYMN